MAETRTRRRAVTLQGVAGKSRRHASLPCLGQKMSWLAPSGLPRESLVLVALFLCPRGLQSRSKLAAGLRAYTSRKHAVTRGAWDARGRPECIKDGERLDKIFPSPRTGVRNQTHLLVVAAGGPDGWV